MFNIPSSCIFSVLCLVHILWTLIKIFTISQVWTWQWDTGWFSISMFGIPSMISARMIVSIGGNDTYIFVIMVNVVYEERHVHVVGVESIFMVKVSSWWVEGHWQWKDTIISTGWPWDIFNTLYQGGWWCAYLLVEVVSSCNFLEQKATIITIPVQIISTDTVPVVTKVYLGYSYRYFLLQHFGDLIGTFQPFLRVNLKSLSIR